MVESDDEPLTIGIYVASQLEKMCKRKQVMLDLREKLQVFENIGVDRCQSLSGIEKATVP